MTLALLSSKHLKLDYHSKYTRLRVNNLHQYNGLLIWHTGISLQLWEVIVEQIEQTKGGITLV